MTIAVFDSSAFVKLLVDEPGSDRTAGLWDDADLVAASRLAYPEVHAALSAARRGARLSPAGEHRARRDWDAFWMATRVVEVTAAIAGSAALLAARHALSGADAVHLAGALSFHEDPPLLVAWDARLRQAASAEGLWVVPAAT